MWLAQIPLLVLFIRRLRQPMRAGKSVSPARQLSLKATRHGLVVLSAAGIAAIFVIVLSGQSGFIATV
jgi:hypothetical protein